MHGKVCQSIVSIIFDFIAYFVIDLNIIYYSKYYYFLHNNRYQKKDNYFAKIDFQTFLKQIAYRDEIRALISFELDSKVNPLTLRLAQ